MFVNEKWCHRNNMSMKHKVCTPNVELLTVSVRLYYIPQEFSHVLITTVYVPPSTNAKDAANVISSHVIDLETSAPDAFKIITSDFNHCSLKFKTSIINYFQHVKCATWKDHILDQCYTNVKDAYTSVSLPLLGRSDHNIVQLIPRYRPLVQREPTVTRAIKEWSDDDAGNQGSRRDQKNMRS